MQQTFESIFQLASPLLPPQLVAAASLAHLGNVARLLPAAAVNFFGFESRLGGEIGAADCALSLTPDGARFLAGLDPAGSAAELTSAAWNKVRGFFQAWGATREPPFADAGATWLEFDASQTTPEPNLLFGYWPRNTESRRSVPWLTGDILPLLMGKPLSPGLERNLRHCLDADPGPDGDFQIGVMLARSLPAVRVCVFDVPPARALDYLASVGWNGPAEQVQQYVEALAPHADFVGLHVDVGDQVFPHLGIEPAFKSGPWARQPHLEPRWHGQLQALESMGLCTREKHDALLGWVGYQQVSGSQELAEVGGERATLLRGLSHVKVVVRPGTPAIAKAYFGIALRSRPEPTRA